MQITRTKIENNKKQEDFNHEVAGQLFVKKQTAESKMALPFLCTFQIVFLDLDISTLGGLVDTVLVKR